MTSVLIVGAGAIGGSIAAFLARSGIEITIADGWHLHVEAIRRSGLRVGSPGNHFTTRLSSLHLDELRTLKTRVDVLVISTKAYDTEWAYKLARPYLADDGTIISAQNGVMEELLPRYAEMSRFIGCAVNFAAECVAAGFVRRTSAKEWPALTLGELNGDKSERLKEMVRLFSPVGEIKLTTNIFGELWSKLALNCMTNATAALTLAHTNVVWGDPAFLPIVIAAGAETAQVANSRGIEMLPVLGRIPVGELRDSYGGDVAAYQRTRKLLREVSSQRTGAHENSPSMLQDIQKERRTEIGYLNGYVVDCAARAGIPVPVNTRLVELALEVERGDRKPGRRNLDDILSAVPS